MAEQIISASEVIIAAFLGIVGIIIANSMRRQIMLKITDSRLRAYAALWQVMEVASPTRLESSEPKPLTKQEREELHEKLSSWYYKNGNGMLLTEKTRNLYLCVKHNLICRDEKIEPKKIWYEIENTGNIIEIRGRISIRQLSLLRTQMKTDLKIYGSYFYKNLELNDKLLLEHCGQDPGKKPWRPRGAVKASAIALDA